MCNSRTLHNAYCDKEIKDFDAQTSAYACNPYPRFEVPSSYRDYFYPNQKCHNSQDKQSKHIIPPPKIS